jgi:cellulose synthase/poly-beta-1,6-N-acetylglucosamine synthase-like glycosyltransferase
MIETGFFLSLFMIAYVYVGYPLAVVLMCRFVSRGVNKAPIEPFVTILISAYNEESVIACTLDNKLNLDYPQDKLEIIVISDGSTDRTDVIVAAFAEKNVRLIRQEPRAGKTSALNLAVPVAKGEIIVFSDANSLYAPDALNKLVANFADDSVGYVTGKMIYANPDGTQIGEGCNSYMKYENMLRSLETGIGSVVGVDGGIDAIRKSLYKPMNADQLPDFVQPLKVVEQGSRVVYEPDALLWESALKEAGDEYRMRVRVSLRALWALYDMRGLLNPVARPLFAWQLLSHKVLRYLCFIFLLSAYFSNMLLALIYQSYGGFFIIQNLCYLGALAAAYTNVKGFPGKVLVFARYFVLLNVSAAHAFGKFLLGKKQVIWTPRKG